MLMKFVHIILALFSFAQLNLCCKQYFTQFGHMTELSESEFILQ
jgi:hypothetical protein